MGIRVLFSPSALHVSRTPRGGKVTSQSPVRYTCAGPNVACPVANLSERDRRYGRSTADYVTHLTHQPRLADVAVAQLAVSRILQREPAVEGALP